MYHPHHFLTQTKQMNHRTSVPAFLQSHKPTRYNIIRWKQPIRKRLQYFF